MPWKVLEHSRGKGHPRVLKVVAIYQLVQNNVSILTTSKALPKTASVSGLGVTKPVKTWDVGREGGAEKEGWSSALQSFICSTLRATVSVPSLQLTPEPFPLSRQDTRRRLHRSSASCYNLYTCRSGCLWRVKGL